MKFEISRIYLQRTSHDEHRFDSTKTPIVVVLLGKQLTTQRVKRDELSREQPGFLEAFSYQHNFANQLEVRHDHRARAEKRFQVFWKLEWESSEYHSRMEKNCSHLCSTGIAWVHRDEKSNGRNKVDHLPHEVELDLFCLWNASKKNFYNEISSCRAILKTLSLF